MKKYFLQAAGGPALEENAPPLHILWKDLLTKVK